ncbi:expressed unknown protein [Seminavis robusta]|uniref:SAM domain-containing protein n=1 Tax=Seminavis robusta TaxID=568900 RepID=A0A9N8H190_9STRA|nr:expressed unknown protein [Seminavis robusta]|eukprot:Sro13_g009790.1 n/a (328) ;mRNA; f:31853-32836
MMTQIENYSIYEVSSWLIQHGFGSHVDVFRSCEVNGAFLVEMTPTELIDDLGFTPLEATNLLDAIQREKSGCVPTATAYAVNTYVPSAAAMGSFNPSPNNRSYMPAPATNTPSSFTPPDPRIQLLETENNALKQQNAALEADTMHLQGELQNLKAMYDQLVQQQQQAIVPAQPQPAYTPPPPPQQTYTPTPPPQPTYTPTPPPQPTYTPAPSPQPTYPTQTYYQQAPQQQQVDYSQQQAPPQPQQTYATQPNTMGATTATTTDPNKNNGMKKTGFNVIKGAGVGALGGATMGAVAGAILPGMDAGDGAKAGAAMGALGGGVSGFMKK